jgi:hypothetical protein
MSWNLLYFCASNAVVWSASYVAECYVAKKAVEIRQQPTVSDGKREIKVIEFYNPVTNPVWFSALSFVAFATLKDD